MVKSKLMVVVSWLVSLGIYYNLPIAYCVYWSASFVTIVFLILSSLYVGRITADDRVRIKKGLFNVKTAIQTSLCVPAFLYAVIASGSWNTLGLYLGVVACGAWYIFYVTKEPVLDRG